MRRLRQGLNIQWSSAASQSGLENTVHQLRRHAPSSGKNHQLGPCIGKKHNSERGRQGWPYFSESPEEDGEENERYYRPAMPLSLVAKRIRRNQILDLWFVCFLRDVCRRLSPSMHQWAFNILPTAGLQAPDMLYTAHYIGGWKPIRLPRSNLVERRDHRYLLHASLFKSHRRLT